MQAGNNHQYNRAKCGGDEIIRKQEWRRTSMKKQIQGLSLILVSIMLILGYGDAAFFDLSFRWSLIFSIIGIVGAVMTFLPDRK